MAEEKKDPQTLLKEAIKKRDDLNVFIRMLQEMIGESSQPVESAAPASTPAAGEVSDPLSVVYPGMFFGKSQPNAAKMLLERVRRPLKTRVIVEALERGGVKVGGKNPNVNMWSILNRADETFIIVPKAGWGLLDWYDTKVIEKMRKEGGKENGEDGEKEDDK